MFEALGYLLTCWLAADFMSGFWHWLEDRYFDTRWPLIGKYIAKPNQLHHKMPIEFTRGNYWHRNYTAILPAIVAATLASCFGNWSLALVCIMVSQANEIHAWAHQRCNSLVRMLQETGVIQSPDHHHGHHRDPFEIKYCVMTNWLNPILDAFQFWRTAEYALALIGIPVRNVLYGDAKQKGTEPL
ncbi:MAG: fatty acid desaturase CarF family protein [Pirellulaceae bacterium]|nr:fatty acid desaturase CarF family protein [Pirellulaceae bacterium]